MSPTRSARIFVVEDEAAIAIDLSERLAALGYKVCGTAARGEMALERILELRPDLALMDIRLAGSMDGIEVAQRLRSRCDVPIVFLSAYSEPELIGRMLASNSYGFLVKPFEERELHATLQVALMRHAVEGELRKQTILDPLTGLRNRRFLDQVLPTEISRARREEQALSLIMVDVDHFKQLNDRHGHEAGDRVLKRVAFALLGAVRASDLVCRYGGDEFVVVMPDMDSAGAARKIRSICTEIGVFPLIHGANRFDITVSAGVAAVSEAGATPEALLRAADAALYRAKQEGRNRVCEAGLLE